MQSLFDNNPTYIALALLTPLFLYCLYRSLPSNHPQPTAIKKGKWRLASVLVAGGITAAIMSPHEKPSSEDSNSTIAATNPAPPNHQVTPATESRPQKTTWAGSLNEHSPTAFSSRELGQSQEYYRDQSPPYPSPATFQTIEYYQQALERDIEQHGENNPLITHRLYDLAVAYQQNNENKAALKQLLRAEKLAEATSDKKMPLLAKIYSEAGQAQKALSNFKQAIRQYQKALEINKKLYGEPSVEVATSHTNIGGTWYAARNYKKAITSYGKALATDTQLYDPNHINIAADLNNLGLAWDSTKNHKRAIEYYLQVLAIYRLIYGDKDTEIAVVNNHLASSYYSQGDYRKAKNHYQQAFSILDANLGSGHPYTQTAHENMAASAKKLAN